MLSETWEAVSIRYSNGFHSRSPLFILQQRDGYETAFSFFPLSLCPVMLSVFFLLFIDVLLLVYLIVCLFVTFLGSFYPSSVFLSLFLSFASVLGENTKLSACTTILSNCLLVHLYNFSHRDWILPEMPTKIVICWDLQLLWIYDDQPYRYVVKKKDWKQNLGAWLAYFITDPAHLLATWIIVYPALLVVK